MENPKSHCHSQPSAPYSAIRQVSWARAGASQPPNEWSKTRIVCSMSLYGCFKWRYGPNLQFEEDFPLYSIHVRKPPVSIYILYMSGKYIHCNLILLLYTLETNQHSKLAQHNEQL